MRNDYTQFTHIPVATPYVKQAMCFSATHTWKREAIRLLFRTHTHTHTYTHALEIEIQCCFVRARNWIEWVCNYFYFSFGWKYSNTLFSTVSLITRSSSFQALYLLFLFSVPQKLFNIYDWINFIHYSIVKQNTKLKEKWRTNHIWYRLQVIT